MEEYILLILIGIILLTLFIIVVTNIRVVETGKMYVITSNNVYKKTWKSGLNIKVPFIEKVALKLPMTEQLANFDIKQIQLNDSKVVDFNMQVYYIITDPKKYFYGVKNPRMQIEELSLTVIKRIVEEQEFNESNLSIAVLNENYKNILNEATSTAWGIDISRASIEQNR